MKTRVMTEAESALPFSIGGRLVMVLLAIFVSITLAGCGAPVERIAETQSGRPEVTIQASRSRIASALVNKAINDGYTLVEQTEYSLQFRRATQDSEDFAAAMLVGNAYSDNSRWLTYTLTPVGGGIRVVASSELQAAMVGGQVNRQSLDGNNNVFNAYQTWLMELKSRLE